jgi:HAD superfamily hydrolase (TIGR01490 family)
MGDLSGPGAAAIFDLDNTVIRPSSGQLFLRFLWTQRVLTPWQWLPVAARVAGYAAGQVRFPALMAWLTAWAAGGSRGQAWRQSAAFAPTLEAALLLGARTTIQAHQAAGHSVLLASAATPFVLRPVSDALRLAPDAYLGTEIEQEFDRLTGRVQGQACYGAGKLARVAAYAGAHDFDLADCYFYSDSASDAPLLAAVGHPVATNPDRKLARLAVKQGWPIIRFD